MEKKFRSTPFDRHHSVPGTYLFRQKKNKKQKTKQKKKKKDKFLKKGLCSLTSQVSDSKYWNS